jgi:hypothetical protein
VRSSVCVLLALLVPSLALARTAAESEALMRDRIAPKLDLMCGTHLGVRYDVASLGTADVENTCEEPLRYLYYACQTGAARRAIQLARVQHYECRGVPQGHGKLAVGRGKIMLDVQPTDVDMEARLDELKHGLLPDVELFHFQMDAKLTFHKRDQKWEAFIAAPVPVTTATDFCVIDGNKIPLPPTGDPLAPPHARVQCVRDGKVVTDMSADGTGFMTRLDGMATHFDSYKLGRPEGESWVRENGAFLRRKLVVDGRDVWLSSYYADGKLRRHDNMRSENLSWITLDEHGGITSLECGSDAANDPLMRGPCGYDAPHKVTINEPGNLRTVIMTNGKARLVE